MDSVLTGVIGLIGFAIVMVAIAWRRWTNTTASFSRVEALHALVAEASRIAGPPVAAPPVSAPPMTDKDIRPVPQTVAIASPGHQFVVTMPDTPAAGASQVSFKRTQGSNMKKNPGVHVAGAGIVAAVLIASIGVNAERAGQAQQGQGAGFSFRTSVELINVTATVTDAQGHFVSGLKADDFQVYEDGKLQTISQFDSERVPVSLGIALDTSGSMAGEKIAAAQTAVNRFLYDLLGEQDEVFLYRFDSRVSQVSGWTEDRRSVGRMLGSITPNGGTAMYDAVATAVPLAQKGTRRKKALLVISDGNDMNSRTGVDEVRQLIRESEVLVYAIGIDASGSASSSYASSQQSSGSPSTPKSAPTPSAFPGAKKPGTTGATGTTGTTTTTGTRASTGSGRRSSDARLNIDALRSLTDDSGGRTEIILSARDLDPATAGIASELSRQYFLGYSTSVPKDGRWHTIEVKVRRGNYTIRARKGFIAS